MQDRNGAGRPFRFPHPPRRNVDVTGALASYFSHPGMTSTSAFALAGCRFLWAIGCNDVSRHDAVASVRAGFSGRELCALWPGGRGWQLSEGSAWPFSHTFVARRPAST